MLEPVSNDYSVIEESKMIVKGQVSLKKDSATRIYGNIITKNSLQSESRAQLSQTHSLHVIAGAENMELASETLVKYTFDGISSDAVKKTVGNSSPIALNESIECKEENNPVINLTNKFLLKKLSEVEAQLLATPGNNVEESLEM